MLKRRIKTDLILALKKGEKQKVAILRFLLAKIQNEEIKKQKELTDEEVVLILQKTKQELLETKEAAEKGKRKDLQEKAEKELNFIMAYLPAQLSDSSLQKEIEKIIKENKEIYQKNPKAIIGLCIKSLKTRADTKRIIKAIEKIEKTSLK